MSTKQLFFISTALLAVLFTASFASAQGETCPVGARWASEDDPSAYARLVDQSFYTSNEQAFLGVTDELFGVINAPRTTHKPSYVVLDMGEGEEVYDRKGADLVVLTQQQKGTKIYVYVSPQPTTGWKLVGVIRNGGAQEVSIDKSGYEMVRYVKLVNKQQRTDALVDSVRAYCIPEEVEEVPEFGVLATLGVLIIAGIIIARKRNA